MRLFNRFKKKEEERPFSISTPVKGKVVDIKDTEDPVFNSESLGKGIGVIAENSEIVAPIGGVISSFFPTKHAIGIKTDKGVEILIHVGIDTVELNGKYFTALKKQGDHVNRGDALLNVEFDQIEKAGYDTTVLMVVANTMDYKDVRTISGNKELGEIVIEVEEN